MYLCGIDERHVKSFQYRFLNVSILYHNFLSQLNDKFLNLVPIWLAPNVITLLGLATVVLGHSFTLYTNYQDSTKSFVMMLTLFLYQTLDNLDGKQARRTGNATPLGMLFDHGCDSINCVLIPMSIMKISGFMENTSMNIIFLTQYLMGTVAFYFAQWCFYHTGLLVQTQINPVDEGIMFMQFLMLLSGLFGHSFWNYNIYGLQMHELIFYVCLVGAFLQTLGHVKRILFDFRKELMLTITFANLFIVGLFFIIILQLLVITPHWLQNIHNYYRFVYAFGFTISINIIRLMLDRVTQTSHIQFTLANITISLLTISLITIESMLKIKSQGVWQSWLLLGISLSFWIHFAMGVAKQLSQILKISIFKINKVK